MNKKTIEKRPIVAGDIIKVTTWLLTFAVSIGYFTTEQSEQITAIIPAIAGLVAVLVNVVIARVQWSNVTPWNADNPLVKYPEDLTGYEPGSAASKKQASE